MRVSYSLANVQTYWNHWAKIIILPLRFIGRVSKGVRHNEDEGESTPG